MKMTVKKVRGLIKDIEELKLFTKSAAKKDGSYLSNEYIKRMKHLSGAAKELETQLNSMEIEVDLNTLYLSKFNIEVDSE